MSFEQYGQFQGAPGQEPAPGQVGSPQDGVMGGIPDQVQQQQYAPQGEDDMGNGQPAEGKTTLWYDRLAISLSFPANMIAGWVSLSHGLMRTLYAIFGFRWESKLV